MSSKNFLGNSVMVARLTLDQLVEVRILVPQFSEVLKRRELTKADKSGLELTMPRLNVCLTFQNLT